MAKWWEEACSWKKDIQALWETSIIKMWMKELSDLLPCWKMLCAVKTLHVTSPWSGLREWDGWGQIKGPPWKETCSSLQKTWDWVKRPPSSRKLELPCNGLRQRIALVFERPELNPPEDLWQNNQGLWMFPSNLTEFEINKCAISRCAK